MNQPVTGWKATLAIIAAVAALFVVVNLVSEETMPTIPAPSPPVVTSVTPTAG